VFEVAGRDDSRYLLVVACAGSVDGPDIGGVFVPGEVESDLEDELVDLGIEFGSEE
jgi:hypothetical protein